MPKKLTQQEFIIKSNSVHNNTYDYSLVIYENSHKHVNIICKTHGSFTQKPYAHLNGQGCPSCAQTSLGLDKRKNLKSLKEQFKTVHGNKFNYDEVVYKNNYTAIKIYCNKHKCYFTQTPKSHLKSDIGGCKDCIAEHLKITYKKKSYEDFVRQAELIYNTYYQYRFDTFVYRLNVDVICPVHGEFSTTQKKFLNSYGCSVCHPKKYVDTIAFTKTNYVTLCENTGSNLYLIKLSNDNEIFYKIGISNNPKRRFKFFDKKYKVEVLSLLYLKDVSTIWDLEKQFHKTFKSFKYKPNNKFHGDNECFLLTEKHIDLYLNEIKEYQNV
jgi:hypothetical protein